MEENQGKPPPKCKAILLCDYVIVEAGTGKTSVIGITDSFVLEELPGPTARFFVYVQLTDGIGLNRISTEVHDLREDLVAYQGPAAELEFRDRSVKQVLVIPIPPLSLDHDGVYDFVVFANGVELDRQKFTVRTSEDDNERLE